MKYLLILILLFVATVITTKYFILQQNIEGQIESIFNSHRQLYAISSTDREYFVITRTKVDENRFYYMKLFFNNCINHPSTPYCIPKNSEVYPVLLRKAAAFWEEECTGYHKADFDILLNSRYDNDYFETFETPRRIAMEVNLQKLKIGEYTIHQFRSYNDVIIKVIFSHMLRDILIGLVIILIVSIANKPSRNWIKNILEIK